MALLPVPQESKFMFRKAGVNHVSPYTRTSIGRVEFSTRYIWHVRYEWKYASRETNENVLIFLMTAAGGVTTLPMYFHERPGLQKATMEYQNAVDSVVDDVITITASAENTFTFLSGDKVQVGRYCLYIVKAAGRKLTIANMPKDLPSKVSATSAFKTEGYTIQAVNEKWDLGYGRRTQYAFEPEIVEFSEIF